MFTPEALFHIYHVVRVGDKRSIGGVILPNDHYGEVRIYRYPEGEEQKAVPTVMIPVDTVDLWPHKKRK